MHLFIQWLEVTNIMIYSVCNLSFCEPTDVSFLCNSDYTDICVLWCLYNFESLNLTLRITIDSEIGTNLDMFTYMFDNV
mgnify:CR=1 FL=1